MTRTYRQRPVRVEAVRYDPDIPGRRDMLVRWIGPSCGHQVSDEDGAVHESLSIKVPLPNGGRDWAWPGDWVVKRSAGGFRVVDQETFEEEFEPVEDGEGERDASTTGPGAGGGVSVTLHATGRDEPAPRPVDVGMDRFRTSSREPWPGLVEFAKEHGLGIGFTSVPVLTHLWGREWNETTFNWLPAASPGSVRVVDGSEGETSDVGVDRVTVRLGDDGRIERIDKEVRVLLNGARHAHDLDQQTKAMDRVAAGRGTVDGEDAS